MRLAASIVLLPLLCKADSGALLFRGQMGDRTISVFTVPAELEAGRAEVSVLIEDQAGKPAVGEPVEVRLGDEAGRVVSKSAQWGGGGNSAMAAATVSIPQSGDWRLMVRFGGSEVMRHVKVAEARGRLLAHWRTWVFVPVLLALFLWHQALLRGGKQALGVGR